MLIKKMKEKNQMDVAVPMYNHNTWETEAK